MTKRILSLMISLIMVVSLVGALPAFTASAETYGDYEYEILYNGTVEITEYTGNATDVEIPSEIDGKAVTSIRGGAFCGCDSLTSVTIPDSVADIVIGNNGVVPSFYNCKSLTEINVDSNNKNYSSQDGVLFNNDKTVLIIYPEGKTQTTYTIPDSVTDIGGEAFYSCTSLTSITIPDRVWNIAHGAFAGCSSLTGITIPDSVKQIGESAFMGCSSLTSVTIGYGVRAIVGYAFDGCESLTEINVDSDNENYSSQDGVLFNYDKTELIQYPAGKTQTSYTIPESVTRIDGDGFGYCTSLTEINVDSNNKNYSSQDGVLFNNDKTELILYPRGKTQTAYTIPNSVTSFGYWSFQGCKSLTSITIPDSAISIEYWTFSNCESLTEINVDSNNKNYSSQDGVLFNYDKTELIKYPSAKTQTAYTIPNSVTIIGDYAFELCDSLTSITIPNSVASIGWYAFSGCDCLTSITIPSSVISIEYGAFDGCDNLTIKCYKGSYAERYALDNGIDYEILICEHDYQNGSCIVCGGKDSNYTDPTESTSAPTTAKPAPTTNAPKATTAAPKATTPTTPTKVAKPAKVAKVKATAKKKKLNVSWKKVSGATGYEVLAATNNKFTKNKKTVDVKKNKAVIKKLKAKKKYFVKVRAYKTVNGTKYYGKWSKVVKKKTK